MKKNIGIVLNIVILLLAILLAIFYFADSQIVFGVCFVVIALLNIVALILRLQKPKN